MSDMTEPPPDPEDLEDLEDLEDPEDPEDPEDYEAEEEDVVVSPDTGTVYDPFGEPDQTPLDTTPEEDTP
jgi:hypothetical protein